MKLKNILLSSVFSIGLLVNSCVLPTNYLPSKENYSGIVVFAYANEEISRDKKESQFYELTNNLIKDGKLQESVNNWYKNQAKKYGKSIDIKLTEYSKEIKIPDEFITDSEFPIDIIGLTKYIKTNFKEVNNYDFFSIIYQMDFNGSRIIDYSFPQGNSFVLRYYNPTTYLNPLFSKNPSFAHEFSHLLGASDKYNNYPEVEELDIMKQGGVQEVLDEKVLITEPTAREIGW